MTDALLRDLERGAPALARCLSPIGRRVRFPKGIPFQARAARGTELNATVGQVTDGKGHPLPLKVLQDAAPCLDLRAAFLYSPQPGHPEVRERWLAWQLRRAGRDTHTGTLPFATRGLTHGISICADLFVDDDTTVILPGPAWENYDLLFTLRTQGAKIVRWPFFADGALNLKGLEEALAGVTGKAVCLLNFPANPTGYSPTLAEADAIVELLHAHTHPMVVIVDDAYQGVVHEPGLLDHSLYWRLVDTVDPERTAVVKIDGATKELLFFPSRIGFLTADIRDDAARAAFTNKLNGLVRGTVGGPPGPSQAIMLAAMQQPERTETEFAERLALLTTRYRVLKEALGTITDPRVRPLPFNSAYFAMIDLDPSLVADDARMALIDAGVGTIALPGTNALRVAYCSTRAEDLGEIVSRLGAVIAAM